MLICSWFYVQHKISDFNCDSIQDGYDFTSIYDISLAADQSFYTVKSLWSIIHAPNA
jgi:hypothetical protein